MSLVIGTNRSALFAQDALRSNLRNTSTTMERLSTGVRVNSAKDDAAGLAIGQSMTAQIRGLDQAIRNINDGINLIQTADGGLNSVSQLLQRMRELAVQSANGSNSDTQRAYLQQENAALQTQIDNVISATTWNGQSLLDGTYSNSMQLGSEVGSTMDVEIPGSSLSALGLRSVVNSEVVTKDWTELLGSTSDEWSYSSTTGLDGFIYVCGSTAGSLDGVASNGGSDAFVTKYNTDGTKVWTQLLGTGLYDIANALTTGLDGSIYVSGFTDGNFDGLINRGGGDAFITKLNTDGTKAWTKLLSSSGADQPQALTIGLDGSVYVSGSTTGSLDGATNSGGYDSFLTKYGTDGTKAWTKLLGSGLSDWNTSSTTGLDGSIYVSGSTTGSLEGVANSGIGDAFLTKYNSDGSQIWTKLIGTSSNEDSFSLTTGLDGSIYVSGYSNGSLDGLANSGGYDAFITKFNTDGTKVWTKLLGTSFNDIANSLTTGLDGSIYVTGNTSGSLDGETNSGERDAFLTKYGTDGTKAWTKLLGTSSNDYGNSLTTGLDGSIYVSGSTLGSLDGEINSGGYDAFITKFSDVTTSTTLITDISSSAGAASGISAIDAAIDKTNESRAKLGSYINSLTYAADNATSVSSNATQSRSTIMDADYALESTNLAKTQIVQQAATAMLAQANQQPQAVMALLKNLYA